MPRMKDIVRKVDIVSEQLKIQPSVYYAEKTDLTIPEDTSVAIVNDIIIEIIEIIFVLRRFLFSHKTTNMELNLNFSARSIKLTCQNHCSCSMMDLFERR